MTKTTEAHLRKTRFAQVPLWVANHPDVLAHPTALGVYVHLAMLADFKTRVTTSDWREITEATGWSKPTVMRAMRLLRDASAIHRQGDHVILPMDPPAGIKSDTGPDDSSIRFDTDQDQNRDSTGSDLRPALFLQSNSEVLPEVSRLCELFADLIAERGAKRPTVSKTWIEEMDRLIRLDGRSPASVERTLRWLAGGRDPVATFWRPNVRSPAKLRQQWDHMAEQYTARRPGTEMGAPAKRPEHMTDQEFKLYCQGLSEQELLGAQEGRQRYLYARKLDEERGSA